MPGAVKVSDYSLGGVNLNDLFHNVNIGGRYRTYLNNVMQEAYYSVMGSEESRKDLTSYMLYRGKNLIDNAVEEEHLALEIRAIALLKDYINSERSDRATAGTIAACAAGVAAAGAIAAGLLLSGALAVALGIVAAACAVVAGTMFYQANALGEVVRDLNDQLNGKRRVDGDTNNAFDKAYKDWLEKKRIMDDEWKKLNLMYYGQETKPAMVMGHAGEMRLPEVAYASFLKGVRQMHQDDAARGISLDEALALYNEAVYKMINAGEGGTVSEAIKAYNI